MNLLLYIIKITLIQHLESDYSVFCLRALNKECAIVDRKQAIHKYQCIFADMYCFF